MPSTLLWFQNIFQLFSTAKSNGQTSMFCQASVKLLLQKYLQKEMGDMEKKQDAA